MKEKILWILAGGFFAALFLWGRSCGINSVTKVSNTDTVVRLKTDTFLFSNPTYVYIERQNKMKFTTDTLWMPSDKEIVILPETTPPFVIDNLNDYEKTRFYDTSGEYFSIKDTVYHNRIIGRELVIKRYDTTITNTETIYPPKKNIGYFSIYGNRYEVGGGFAWKTKKDWIYNVEYSSRKNISGRLLIPIKLN